MYSSLDSYDMETERHRSGLLSRTLLMERLTDVRGMSTFDPQQPDYMTKSCNEQNHRPVTSLLLLAGTIGCHLGLPGTP